MSVKLLWNYVNCRKRYINQFDLFGGPLADNGSVSTVKHNHWFCPLMCTSSHPIVAVCALSPQWSVGVYLSFYVLDGSSEGHLLASEQYFISLCGMTSPKKCGLTDGPHVWDRIVPFGAAEMKHFPFKSRRQHAGNTPDISIYMKRKTRSHTV